MRTIEDILGLRGINMRYIINYIATQIYKIIGIIIRIIEYTIIGTIFYDRILRINFGDAYELAKYEYNGSYYNLYDKIKMLFVIKCRTIEFEDSTTCKQIIIFRKYIRVSKDINHNKIIHVKFKRMWIEDELLWGLIRMYVVQILFARNYGIAIAI